MNQKKIIKSINIETNQIFFFKSKRHCAHHHNCYWQIVNDICEHLNGKTIHDNKIRFEYVNENDVKKNKIMTAIDGRIGKRKYSEDDQAKIIRERSLASYHKKMGHENCGKRPRSTDDEKRIMRNSRQKRYRDKLKALKEAAENEANAQPVQ